MFFRPEEVHGASGIAEVFVPPPKGHSHVPHDIFRFGNQDVSILDLDTNHQPAIQTGAVDPYSLARKEPADRQRFEASLAKPFLLAIDGNSVLGREIVKGGKRGNKVCLGI